MAEEALQSFESLLAKIPVWIADLEAIARSSAQRQVEALRDYKPDLLARPRQLESQPSHIPSKSSSLQSTRSRDDIARRSSPPGLKIGRSQFSPLTVSAALRLTHRKRHPSSATSDNASSKVPATRTSGPAVVFFDGETQRGFEALLRAVGSNRNSLRKGKMSATVDALSRLGSSGSDSSSNSSGGEEACPKMDGLYLTVRRTPGTGRASNTAAFDQVDKLLEKAQIITERAAHQFLRNGGCAAELNTARERFEEARRIGEAELPNLNRKAERHRRCEERRRREEDEEEEEEEEEEDTVNGRLEVDGRQEVYGEDCFADIERKFKLNMKQMSMGTTLSLPTATNTQPSTPPQILDVDINVDAIPDLDHVTGHDITPLRPVLNDKYRRCDTRLATHS